MARMNWDLARRRKLSTPVDVSTDSKTLRKWLRTRKLTDADRKLFDLPAKRAHAPHFGAPRRQH
jgi:hypothetical protein